MCAMLNLVGSSSAPSARMLVQGDARSRRVALDQRLGNRSMPAGTGVWVVKTVPARTADSASGRSGREAGQRPDPLEAQVRRAIVRVETPLAPDALRPRMRWSLGPHRCREDLLLDPLGLVAAVQPFGDCLARLRVFPSMSASNSNSGTRPTRACETRAKPPDVGIGTARWWLPPSCRAPVRRQAARVEGRVVSCCQPSLDRIARVAEHGTADQRPRSARQVGGGLEVVSGQDAKTRSGSAAPRGPRTPREVADARRLPRPRVMVPARVVRDPEVVRRASCSRR